MTFRVLDTETGEVRETDAVAETGLEEGIRSGRLQISTEAGPVGLRDEAGEAFDVDPENLAAALRDPRFRLATPQEERDFARQARERAYREEAVEEARANPIASGLEAFGTSALEELSFGGSALHRTTREQIERQVLEEENPLASGAGTVAGIVAPALLTSGIGTGGAAARVGLRGAAALTPGGLAAAGGQILERTLARQGLSRGASFLAGATADGALGGITSAITEANLHGEPIEAEQILGNALFGAVLGLGTGGVLHGGSRALGAIADVARGGPRLVQYADDLARAGLGEATGVRRIAGGIEAVVNPRAADEGIAASLRRMSERVSGVDPDDLAMIAANPRGAFDAVDAITDVAGRGATSLRGLGSQVDELLAAGAPGRAGAFAAAMEGVEAGAATATARATLDTVSGRIAEGLETFGRRGQGGRALAGLEGEVREAAEAAVAGAPEALNALDRVVRSIDSAAERAGSEGARGLLTELRTTVANVAGEPELFGRGAALFSELDGASSTWRELRDALNLDRARLLAEVTERGAASSATIGRLGESLEAAERIVTASERMGASAAPARALLQESRIALGEAISRGELAGAVRRGLAAEGGSALSALVARGVGAGASRAGGALGAILGGGPGFAVGSAVGGAVETAAGALQRPVSTYQRIARLGRAVEEYAPRVERGAATLRRALESGALISGMRSGSRATSRVVSRLDGTREERLEEYRDVRDQLRTMTQDPEALASRLGSTVGPVSDLHPQLADHLAVTSSRAVSYLARSLPDLDRADPTLFGDYDIEPNPFEIDAFLARYEAIEDPASLLERAAEGSLALEHTEAVREVYPEIYADLAARVTEVLGELDEPPPYALRIQLGTLLGVPADPSLTPAMIDALQTNYAHTGAQYQAQNSPAPTGSLARVGSTLSQQATAGTATEPRL